MKTKEIRGITIISLVITVIILLILSGVSISTISGENGILTKARLAKQMSEASSEREAIELLVATYHINSIFEEKNEFIGKTLYSKNFVNSDKWDYIFTISDKKIYGDDWYNILPDTELNGYGKTKNNWLVNYETGEIIELKDGEYTELSVNDTVAITDGLIFNIDSKDISVTDKSTWGNGVELYGFENNSDQNNDGIYFDGVDDYISFKSGTDFENGLTFSFYGIQYGSLILAKQKAYSAEYSCRFGWNDNQFSFNTSKNRANSTWSQDDSENNGNLITPVICKQGEVCYIDLTFEPKENKFVIYQNGNKIDETFVENEYWIGKDGGKQILEDSSINCYVGKWFGGVGKWNYTKCLIYNMKFYNRGLSQKEIESNYAKTMAYHST